MRQRIATGRAKARLPASASTTNQLRDNRVTCHYERKTGTNLVSLHCETLAQREQNARESQEFMRERAARLAAQ